MTRLSIYLFCLLSLCKGIKTNSLKLEQVLILSRHNIRTPLTSKLEVYAPKPWPKFKEPVAHLTQKGALLEGYMAEYISQWLDKENFIKGCPKQEEVLIYSNTKPRTLATADAFAKSAFQPCNISVYHNENLEVFDPVFYPIFPNNSEYFKQQMIEDMQRKINEVDLTESYLELNRILDLKNSDICKKKSICDLSTGETGVVYIDGEEPEVSGPLYVATSIVDLFFMSFYEGFPMEDVAWGQILTDKQWKLLGNIIKQDQNVRFNFKPGSEDISGPLLKYMFDIFKSGNPKFTVLVGHDSNVNPVINALNIKDFELEGQYEPFPIGGKLVFQKWSDDVKMYLKVEYLYQSALQIRNSEKLSLENPPYRVTLELNDCKIDEHGFCPWEEFMKLNF